ncbi:dTDP-4-dehydrorhamnose reductase [Acaryochloris sp. CCMEE 5410]|uniref:dTDP-4-dehydrorhamnose reductase n=1 Tax=Acaryochloris sp. CCMEE 5410 TaxID=310037 RepID=UPI0002484042|nr:dTDP-4-dehydrorhamnose reductase [Acaryochloris sp. CCMEE 5410]KAI9130806.1 dTDP-4-dehydrorhamnose reductase [Acaryochloris sp. CCMEE 5410]
MAKSRILLLGAQGQLGQELQKTLPTMGELIAVGKEAADLAVPEQLHKAILPVQPDIIVNAAAYTAVDQAESEVELAHTVNQKAPTVLADIAKTVGALLVHISTDYVFDGTQSHPYTESDSPNPQSVYGHSKWQGEEGIRHIWNQHIILRTAWVYGTQGKGNFVKTMLRLGRERSEVRVVDDQVGAPTWAKEIGDAIATLIHHWSTSDPATQADLYGTYHFTNRGVASWYDFAVAIFAEAQALGVPLQIERVIPITTPEYPLPAPRPAYSVLSNSKITPILGKPAPHWRQSLRQMLQELVQDASI